jgi:hypothetical protein
MKVMTNEKGLYCIRKGIWPFYKYFDIIIPCYWWRKNSEHYWRCWGQKDKVQAWFGILNPKVAVIIADSNDKQL